MPLCRVPSTSPSPRSRKSSSAMRKPSSVSRMIGKPRLGGLAERRLVEQQAGRRLGAAPDAAAQLVELRQPEALGVLDHHDGRVRHVDADLDHRGGDQDAASRRPAKRAMARSLSAPFMRPWTRPTRSPKCCFRSAKRCSAAARSLCFSGFLDQRADPVDALAVVERARRPPRSPRRAGRAARRGCRSAGGRPASPAAPRFPCRRKTVSTSVRGIGVAVITSMSTAVALARRAPAAGGRRSGAARR